MVLPQAMAWVQYWFRVLSLKFCGKSKKNCGDISQVSPAFCMYAYCWGHITWNQSWSLKTYPPENPHVPSHVLIVFYGVQNSAGTSNVQHHIVRTFGCLGHACIVLASLHSLTTSPTPEYGHEQNHHSFPRVKTVTCIYFDHYSSLPTITGN